MCDVNSPDFRTVAELAHTTADPDLSAALTLIIRGHALAHPVKRALLNAAACMMDAHDAAAGLFSRKGIE
jgi:hypothetical protein